MHWNSAADFFAMGGYGFYVWGSFGVCAAAILIELWLLRRSRRATIESVRRQIRAAEAEGAPR